MALDRRYLNNAPPGFQVIEQTDDSVVLRYKQRSRGCVLIFLFVFGAIWLSFAGFLILGSLATNVGFLGLFGLAVACFGLFTAGILARMVMTTYVLRIEPEALTVSSGISTQTISASIARCDISRIFVRLKIVQSPRRPHSYSRVWSVVAYTPTAVQVLPRAGRQQCEWLGNFLGEWAGCLVETDN